MSLDFYLYCTTDTEHTVFDRNYTHNVTPMWKKAGCYDALYESDGKRAGEIIPELNAAFNKMISGIREYKELDPDNGWVDADGALSFLEEVLRACRTYPSAKIGVSR